MFKINVKRNFFYLIALNALCALCIAGCASTTGTGSAAGMSRAPEWVFSPDAEYSNDRYLSAVGWDKDRSASVSKAKAELVKSIRQTVETQSASSVSFSDQNGAFSESRDIQSDVHTFTSLEIAGLTIKETWRDRDGTYYSLALLDRDEAGRYYRTLIQKNADVINSQIMYANNNQESFDSYSAAKRALSLAKENDEYLSLLSAINPASYMLVRLDYGSSQSVSEFAKRILGKIRIALSITGDRDGTILSSFINVFTAAGFTPSVSTTGNYPYTFKITVNIEDVGIVGNYERVRYTIDAALHDVLNDKVLLPWTTSGNEAHTTREEARRRAIRLINDDIRKSFAARFSAFLE